MALDDQLAALAAGELDDDTARALRARVAADPALARQLARHEQLERLLVDWEAPGMSEEGVGRLESRIDEALAALGDEPLAERSTPAAAPAAAPAATDEPARDGADQPGVVDMAGARRRRDDASSGRGAIAWPSWGAGAAVAAALVAVVGTGVVLGGLPGGGDLDMLAGDDSAEDTADVAQLESDDSAPMSDADGEAADEDAAGDAGLTSEERTRLDPAQGERVEVAEGELLALVELAADEDAQESASATEETEDTDGEDDAETDEGADASADTPAAEPAQQCVQEALQRDTAQADDREVWLLADGTYAGQDAAFVVVRTPQPSGEDRYEVLAYDPGDCSLLARDATSR